VASFLEVWKGKPVELRYKSLLWAETQVSQGTQWGMMMWRDFEVTKANRDCYNKNSYIEYLKFMKDPKVFGMEYDIIVLCEFLQVSIKVNHSTQDIKSCYHKYNTFFHEQHTFHIDHIVVPLIFQG
jgi:hypothetical protein